MKKQTTPEVEIQTNIAAEYVAIRWEIEKHEARRRELEPIVQEWCSEQITALKGNKKVAYICPNSKAQLVLREVRDESFIKNHPDVQCLDELVQLEREKARYENNHTLVLLEEQVLKIQKQIEHFSLTNTGRDLVEEREVLVRGLKKDPQYFKKQVAFKAGS